MILVFLLCLIYVVSHLRYGTTRDGDLGAVFIEILHDGWPYCFMIAVRDLQAGEEVLVDYSNAYWEGMYLFFEVVRLLNVTLSCGGFAGYSSILKARKFRDNISKPIKAAIKTLTPQRTGWFRASDN